MISAIVAIDENNAIGRDNRLLAYLPNDLKYFKSTTLGHSVIMGRKTYESLPVKPLPGRKNIIISQSLSEAPGCIIVPSIEKALEQCDDNEEYFITGGMQIYRQMMPYVQKLYVTRIHHRFEADAYFPEIKPDIWQLQSSERHEPDEKHPYAYSFEIYLRR